MDADRSNRRRAYHHGDLRSALVDAALEEVERRGAAGVTIRGTARAVGVSHTAPYRHFPSKEALLAAVAETGFRELAALLEAARDGHPGSALRAVARAFLRFALDRPALYRLMFGGEIPDHHRHEGLHQAAGEAFAVLAGVVAPPPTRAVLTWSALHGLADLAARGRLGISHPAALAGLADRAVEFVLRALALES